MCCFSLHLSYYCLYLQLAFIGECDIGGSIGCTDRPVNLWTRNAVNIFIILIFYDMNISFHIHRQADTPLNSADRIGALVQTYWLEEKFTVLDKVGLAKDLDMMQKTFSYSEISAEKNLKR